MRGAALDRGFEQPGCFKQPGCWAPATARKVFMMQLARHLPELLCSEAERLGARPGLRVKRHGMWVDVSWKEWQERVEAAALGLLALGLQMGERVAILSENRLEWIFADLAILSAGGVTVPLHAPLGPRQIQQMLADSGAAAVSASNTAQADKGWP